jgi:hypothetical protein
MNMVCNSTDSNGITFQILEDTGLICPKALAKVKPDKWPTVFGGKDDVSG